MNYRKLGRWGIKISEIVLGGWLTAGGYVNDDVLSNVKASDIKLDNDVLERIENILKS